MGNIQPTISVIVPYRNESQGLVPTLELLLLQTVSPNEIIFVNSSSTDNSFEIIENWSKENSENMKRLNIKIFNLSMGTNNPASSKNVGIKYSTSDLIAFMDCGLDFSPNWLEMQLAKMNKSNLDMVFGSCHYQGKGVWDSCAVALTSGLNVTVPSTPGSLIKKKMFNINGPFLENRRAGYDIEWRMKAANLSLKHAVNYELKLLHRGYNFANGAQSIFKKCFIYTIPSVGLKYYSISKKYWMISLITIIATLISLNVLISWLVSYGIIRSYIWPTIKSKNLKILREYPQSIILLPITALLVDLGRFSGLIVGYFNYYLRGMKFADKHDVLNY